MAELKPLAYGLSFDDWTNLLKEIKEPAFRAKQIWDWLYVRRIRSFDEMTNLSAALRARLNEHLYLNSWVEDTFTEAADGTRKLLLACRDGEKIESVIIPAPGRATVCVSTQAGCGFGCAFCATGTCGLSRNLEAGEIVGQVMSAYGCSRNKVTNVVFMGMGEPFSNYDNVLKAIRILNDQKGLQIGARKITLSTCGVVPGIRKLSDEGLQVELSISLHAPTDELRNTLMPINKTYSIEDLMDAASEYTKKTGRIITFEYTLVKDLNDSIDHATQLASLVKPLHGRVNLIPLSPVEHFSGVRPTMARCDAFLRRLEHCGVNATIRYSKGSDNSAACGQLKVRETAEGPGGN